MSSEKCPKTYEEWVLDPDVEDFCCFCDGAWNAGHAAGTAKGRREALLEVVEWLDSSEYCYTGGTDCEDNNPCSHMELANRIRELAEQEGE